MEARLLVTVAVLSAASWLVVVHSQQVIKIRFDVPAAVSLYHTVTFYPNSFSTFFQCLCEGTNIECSASYVHEGSDYVIRTVSKHVGFTGIQEVSKYYYLCEMVPIQSRFACTQLNQTARICSTSPYFQTARFNVTPSCDESCFTLFWKYQSRDLPAGWFKDCDAGKACKAVSTNIIKTTTKPSFTPQESTQSLSQPASTIAFLKSSSSSSSHTVPYSNSSTPLFLQETTKSTGTILTSPPFIVVIIVISIVTSISLSALL